MESDFKEYPKTLPSDDFWGQIKRTVNGKPVSEEQIQMIVQAVRDGLCLQTNDYLLDLACGNGALSRYFFADIAGFLGVDFSDYLISIAKQHFERLPQARFTLADAESYVLSEAAPQLFTKVLCYGSFSYFSESAAEVVLSTLHQKFVNVEIVYLGNLPDLARCESFYYTAELPDAAALKDPNSKIGIWRSELELAQLAAQCGWQMTVHRMPKEYYAQHYRFDAILRRKA